MQQFAGNKEGINVRGRQSVTVEELSPAALWPHIVHANPHPKQATDNPS